MTSLKVMWKMKMYPMPGTTVVYVSICDSFEDQAPSLKSVPEFQ